MIVIDNIHPYIHDIVANSNDGETLHKFIKNINDIKKESSSSNIHILFMDVSEGRIYHEPSNLALNRLQDIILDQGIKDYTFVLDAEYQHLSKVKNINNVIYSDFLLLSVYTRIFLSKNHLAQRHNRIWNSQSTKGLFTPGKIERPHRILLMSKLWEHDLLKSMEYSFYCPESVKNQVRKIINYDNDKFNNFLYESLKSLDFKKPVEGSFQYNGFPYNPKIYENTSFSIITESDFSGCVEGKYQFMPKITEKTYRAIVNFHPFIQVWYPGIIEKLQVKGFKTFEEYMLNPDYHTISDINERVDQAIKNIQQMHVSLTKNKVKVLDDIQYNYHHFKNLAELELEKFDHIFNTQENFTGWELGLTLFGLNNQYF